MNIVLSYIIFYISWLQLVTVLQWYWCVLCVWFLGITFCDGVLKYVNANCVYKFANVRQIAHATYLVYYAHVYILMVVMYICYLFLIMATNLIYDMYTWIHNSPFLCSVILPRLQLNHFNIGHSLHNIELKNTNDIPTNNMYIGGEKVSKATRIPLLNLNNNLGLTNSDVIQMPKIFSPNVDIIKNSKIVEIEQLLHDKTTLYEFVINYAAGDNKWQWIPATQFIISKCKLTNI